MTHDPERIDELSQLTDEFEAMFEPWFEEFVKLNPHIAARGELVLLNLKGFLKQAYFAGGTNGILVSNKV